jgi:hypothetical protein
MVDRARKKKKTLKIKPWPGKIIPVLLKYLIFAMQNSSYGTPHGSTPRE